MRPAHTDTFKHTISSLLTKRADLFNEAERIRDRLAEIRNDIAANDRTLGVLGYKGDLDVAMPRQKREVIFGRGELSRAIYAELREAEGPLSSRDIARNRDLAEKLAEIGVSDTELNIKNKISRGGFTAVFLVQCLRAIGVRHLNLDDVE